MKIRKGARQFVNDTDKAGLCGSVAADSHPESVSQLSVLFGVHGLNAGRPFRVQGV